MAIAKIQSATVVGLDAVPIEVEVDIGNGLPIFKIVGLPDKAVEEAKERVRSAIKNSGLNMPNRHITVNLAPADIKKIGPAFDLPIAVGILLASGQIKPPDANSIFIGELALNGQVREVSGVIAITDMASANSAKVFLPIHNAEEGAIIDKTTVLGVQNLRELVLHLNGEKILLPTPKVSVTNNDIQHQWDMANIIGQDQAKRALVIAAAGGHNIIMTGPPGSGKTLLAHTLPTILPVMSASEVIEATKIYSVSGLLPAGKLVSARPFRNPHHTASDISLIGGGNWPKPGEITLAHRGVLFLDELPEFSRSVLEVLRQPLEDGVVHIARANGRLSFPARFMLVTAQNPCPCGYLGDSEKECSCTAGQIANYARKVSGPLLDRIDLHVTVPRIKSDKLIHALKGDVTSKMLRDKVETARCIQAERFSNSSTKTNAEMTPDEIESYCQLSERSKSILEMAVNRFNLSPRGYSRVLKIARTIADLAEQPTIDEKHLMEAISYKVNEENVATVS